MKIIFSLYILIYLEPKYNEEIRLFLYNYIKIIPYLNKNCMGEKLSNIKKKVCKKI